jgi:hypothetical protein
VTLTNAANENPDAAYGAADEPLNAV